MWQGIKNIYHLIRAICANVWFRFPWKGMTVIGITGTDGKTTTSSLVYHILNKAGKKAALVASVSAVINGKPYDIGFHVTTPRIFALRSYIKKAKQLGVKYFVLEVTSHALDQNRVLGIPFEVGVLTNVTHEHLDYHKTYENYVLAKVKLLKMAQIAVVNRDDESYPLINEKLKMKNEKSQFKIKKFITYGLKTTADVNPKKFPFKTNMIGEFNIYNSLAAISACKAIGILDEDIRRGLKSFKPPIGREDIVYNKDFKVMIDFAHTPNAFEQILSSVRPSTKSRLIHVFGSAGQRDANKRPLMGKVSTKYSDVIILTAEDPRSEKVEKIISEIKSGIPNSKFEYRNSKQLQKFKFSNAQNNKRYVFEIADRREAIEAAIKMAKKGDFVLITGKSHEKSMNYGKGEVAWDEFGAVRQGLMMKDK